MTSYIEESNVFASLVNLLIDLIYSLLVSQAASCERKERD